MHLTVTPHDPLVARDARAFGEGGRAHTMEWFNPSVGAGSLRSLLGKIGGGFTSEMIQNLKASSVRGPLLLHEGVIFSPAPLDFLARKGDRHVFPLRPAPLKNGEGTNLPEAILHCFPVGLEEEFKPFLPPVFWSMERTSEWLASPFPSMDFIEHWRSHGENQARRGFLDALPKDIRTHVSIDPSRGSSREGMLFSTAGLTFLCRTEKGFEQLQMAMEITCGSKNLAQITVGLAAYHPMGSERRLAYWQRDPSMDQAWLCPSPILEALEKSTLIRMVLATPAPFSGGWFPGWLKESDGGLVGTPPGNDVALRLVSAVVGRWQPLSGWSMEKASGPKALRRMVPAGSVFFFEVVGGNAVDLGDIWLRSVCDDEQDRRDGFGLALWGIW